MDETLVCWPGPLALACRRSYAVKAQPTLQTERLVLRPFHLEDAPIVQRLAGDMDIARNTATIPHPYEDGVAERWIGTHRERFEKGESAVFAVTLRPDGQLVGAIGLEINQESVRAELGYWIGKPFWGLGYCTEGARAVLRYAFEDLGLHRVFAVHFKRNPASGRVMQKLGMRHEGSMRQHFRKWGPFEDLEILGILRDEYLPEP